MKKSKMILGLTITIAIILIGTGITYYILIKNEDKVITEITQDLESKLILEDRAYEYGSEITLQELNLDNNVKVYINNEELSGTYKFTEVGEYKLSAQTSQTYKNFLNKESTIIVKEEATIKVEDTKKPIIEGAVDKEVTEGDTIDLKQGITAKDVVDGDLQIVIEGEVDTNKVGEYEIEVKATDKNNNITEVMYKVRVNAKTEEVVKSDNLNSSKQSTQTYTNKSSKSTASKSTNSKKTNTSNKVKNNSSTQNKSNGTKDEQGNKTNSSENSEKQITYKGTTDGKKYYFDERGVNGNYGEKFSW